MRIDDRVEPLVREALDALVKKNAERFARALTAFGDAERATTGYRLTAVMARAWHAMAGRRGCDMRRDVDPRPGFAGPLLTC